MNDFENRRMLAVSSILNAIESTPPGPIQDYYSFD